ncbi:hypothetical protein AALP_AA7G057100 [Arabis alpina]|uniref:Uncharacterized protein n=1 Tax=Arabis alpina TaxID=50452 RepID=A0A087GG52_ARAAL|nr:hypothetical protein AALP_AA7G057100 [Arabis alpina]
MLILFSGVLSGEQTSSSSEFYSSSFAWTCKRGLPKKVKSFAWT